MIDEHLRRTEDRLPQPHLRSRPFSLWCGHVLRAGGTGDRTLDRMTQVLRRLWRPAWPDRRAQLRLRRGQSLPARRYRCGPRAIQGHRRRAARHRLGGTRRTQVARHRRRRLQVAVPRRALLPRHGRACSRRLAELDMFLQVQVEQDQLLALLPLLERPGAAADRPLRPARAPARVSAAGLPGAAGARSQRPRRASSCPARSSSRAIAPLRRHLPLRARAGRRVHARCLPVGIGLAVPARARASRLRAALAPRRGTAAGCH